MLELLRDSIWTFIAAILALVAIFTMIAIYSWQRQRKRLLVESSIRVSLLEIGNKGINGLQLSFNNKPLSNASIHIIKITSIGNLPILSQDFESPLKLIFNKEAETLAADIIRTSPSKIPIEISLNKNTATLSRHLLNPGDEVVCRLLVKNSNTQPEIEARIAGIRIIEQTKPNPILPSIIRLITISLIIGAFLLSPTPKSQSFLEIRSEELPFLGTMLIGIITFFMFEIKNLHKTIKKIKSYNSNKI